MNSKKPRTPRTRSERPRGPGRPRTGQTGPDPRSRLLDAALALFAAQGIAATSLLAVAREAGVTPAMVHYYFGSREQLLDAIVSERVLPLLGRVLQAVAGQGDDPRTLARALVPAVMRMVTDHPWLPPIWVREVLGEGGLLRSRVLANARVYAPLIHERLAAAHRDGRIHPDLDPRLLLVSLVGLTLFPFAAAPIWRNLFDAGDVTTDTMIRHTLALLEHGLARAGQEANHEQT